MPGVGSACYRDSALRRLTQISRNTSPAANDTARHNTIASNTIKEPQGRQARQQMTQPGTTLSRATQSKRPREVGAPDRAAHPARATALVQKIFHISFKIFQFVISEFNLVGAIVHLAEARCE